MNTEENENWTFCRYFLYGEMNFYEAKMLRTQGWWHWVIAVQSWNWYSFPNKRKWNFNVLCGSLNVLLQKINQKNTWELGLIDHLCEIIKVEEENDVETNFQKVCFLISMSLKLHYFTSLHDAVIISMCRTGEFCFRLKFLIFWYESRFQLAKNHDEKKKKAIDD